jgi:hypothetical protein
MSGLPVPPQAENLLMDRTLFQLDDTTHRFRRVGRLARRRFRLEGAELSNGSHTDGRVTVTISGLGSASAGTPDLFDWEADRPIALVIVRAGVDGDDVSFQVGPTTTGSGIGTLVGDGTGIRYVAFCYDAEPDPVAVAVPAHPVAAAAAALAPVRAPAPARHDRVAASIRRPSILGRMLQAGGVA